jgi:hypothetical protein
LFGWGAEAAMQQRIAPSIVAEQDFALQGMVKNQLGLYDWALSIPAVTWRVQPQKRE